VPLDLQWARLNDGGLTLNPAPTAGADATDGSLEIEAVQPLRHVVPPQQLQAPAIVQVAAPVIDWTVGKQDWASVLGQTNGRTAAGTWAYDFVTTMGDKNANHNPNEKIRVTIPLTLKTKVGTSKL
jgi:hypothetical protein